MDEQPVARKETTAIPANAKPVGPLQPTLMERVVSLLPVPYRLGSVLLMTVFGPPGYLLLQYLATGNLAQSLEPVFLRGVEAALAPRAAALLIWTLAHYYVLWMIRRIRLRVAAAEPQIAPLLAEGPETYRQAFRRMSHIGPAFLLMLVYIATSADRLLADRILASPGDMAGPWSLLYRVISILVVQFSFGTLTWVYLSAAWGLWRLGQKPLQLRPLIDEEAMGAKPMGRLSLSISFAAFGMLAFMTLVSIIVPVYIQFLILLIVLTMICTVLFFLPLQGVHEQMSALKSTLKRSVREQWQRVEGPAATAGEAARPTTLDDVGGLLRDLRAIHLLEALERRASALRTWPVDLSILSRLWAIVLAIAIGLATHALRAMLGL